MATDPTPFLSTIAGSSSGLVAIVGGLLVARFVSLDSEQEGAQRVLDDAEARLDTARQRAQEAADRLFRWDARAFLDDRRVMQAIFESMTEAGLHRLADLRRHGEHTRLTDEQIAPFVEEIRAELFRAFQVLEDTIPDSVEVETDGWDAFRRDTPTLPQPDWELAWEVVFDWICERRAAKRAAAGAREAAEREAREHALAARYPGLAGLSALSSAGHLAFRPPILPRNLGAGALNTDWPSIRARRRDELAATLERAEQHVEDVDGEVRRFRQARNGIVRPRGLGLGLVILGYFAVVGIVIPTLLMSLGPADLTRRMGAWVFAGFLSGLVALLGYMALLALRLSRRATAAQLATQGRRIRRRLLRRVQAWRSSAERALRRRLR